MRRQIRAKVIRGYRLRCGHGCRCWPSQWSLPSSPRLIFGADHTSDPLKRVVEAIFGYDVCVHWGLIHHLIRKAGHFMGYGVFSLICFRSFWITLQNAALQLPRQLRAHGMAILVTFLVASADEFHQSLLPNRTGQFSDVLLDCCGAAALCFVLFLGMQAAEGLRQARARASFRLKPAYAGAAA
jgi:VanZ family protein